MANTYLALGDSYTIGEQVVFSENFPCQVVRKLRLKGPDDQWMAPEILAKTGWTTDELLDATSKHVFLPEYDFVTLLIGVNNQYRGRSAENFRPEFRQLLNLALRLSGDRPSRVMVLSIPDWGVTPFAADRDRMAIAREIDLFNQVCLEEARDAGVHFIDITGSQRADGGHPDFLAADGLHPSSKEYEKWANAVSEIMWEEMQS